MKKMLGEERRKELLALLSKAKGPLTGSHLAKYANVSRQVIVNDMNLLKARNEPILATSQGYLYITQYEERQTLRKKIVCRHTAEQTIDELLTIVDCGVTVESVLVEHPIYGEITAPIMVSTRLEVEQFMKQVQNTSATLLSALTDGTHLHVISATSEDLLQLAEQKLRQKGYLVG